MLSLMRRIIIKKKQCDLQMPPFCLTRKTNYKYSVYHKLNQRKAANTQKNKFTPAGGRTRYDWSETETWL